MSTISPRGHYGGARRARAASARAVVWALLAVSLAACGGGEDSGQPSNSERLGYPEPAVADEADCARIAELARTGQPLAALDLAVQPPLPEQVDDVVGTIIPQGPRPTDAAGEFRIGLPDPDADRLVVVAKGQTALSLLEEPTMAAIRAQGLTTEDGWSGWLDNKFRGFAWTYHGTGRDGAVISYYCPPDGWLAFQEAI